MVKHIPMLTFLLNKVVTQMIGLLLCSSETWKGSWST